MTKTTLEQKTDVWQIKSAKANATLNVEYGRGLTEWTVFQERYRSGYHPVNPENLVYEINARYHLDSISLDLKLGTKRRRITIKGRQLRQLVSYFSLLRPHDPDCNDIYNAKRWDKGGSLSLKYDWIYPQNIFQEKMEKRVGERITGSVGIDSHTGKKMRLFGYITQRRVKKLFREFLKPKDFRVQFSCDIQVPLNEIVLDKDREPVYDLPRQRAKDLQGSYLSGNFPEWVLFEEVKKDKRLKQYLNSKAIIRKLEREGKLPELGKVVREKLIDIAGFDPKKDDIQALFFAGVCPMGYLRRENIYGISEDYCLPGKLKRLSEFYKLGGQFKPDILTEVFGTVAKMVERK